MDCFPGPILILEEKKEDSVRPMMDHLDQSVSDIHQHVGCGQTRDKRTAAAGVRIRFQFVSIFRSITLMGWLLQVHDKMPDTLRLSQHKSHDISGQKQ